MTADSCRPVPTQPVEIIVRGEAETTHAYGHFVDGVFVVEGSRVDECRPVPVTVDGKQETIRVLGGADPTPEAVEALGVLVQAARERMAHEHPHAGLIQELMSAWMAIRRQLPANDSRDGRRVDIAAKKDRMSVAIKAIRDALEGES